MMVSGVQIEVVRKNIKNMYLHVLPPEGRVRISAPLDTNDHEIRLFASAKINWIKKKVQKFQNQPRQIKLDYVSGENHYLWGRGYKMQVKHSHFNNVRIKSNQLILSVRAKSTAEQREKVLNEWYRAQLKAELPALIKKWENIIGVKANFTGVKNMRTRWGSCNVRDKRVWVNLQLAKKPLPCLEYIVVHELVHLLEKNHSQVFYSYMDYFLPDWRAVKAELNSFGVGSQDV